ncbi:hypothetical protein DFH06DRAFT_581439 [Mycena polygramma]|nr:hypothetical protein DFH06DRAFT_581439 [Mycena polygramma]
MLDHYYTPRDNQDFSALPFPRHLDQHDPRALPATTSMSSMSMLDVDLAAKPRHPAHAHATVVDLSALALEQLVAFDCDSGSESGSDDGYVSTLLRMQRAPLPSPGASPRKIAGARRVARAVSAPQPQTPTQARAVGFVGMGVGPMMEVDPDAPADLFTGATDTHANTGFRTQMTKAPEGELFQSITAIPGLESTSFEVRCLPSPSRNYTFPSPPTFFRVPPLYTARVYSTNYAILAPSSLFLSLDPFLFRFRLTLASSLPLFFRPLLNIPARFPPSFRPVVCPLYFSKFTQF